MRKWIAWLLVLAALGLGATYLMVPNTIVIKKQSYISFPANAFSRSFLNQATWLQWWPGDTENKASSTHFSFNGNQYAIREKKHSSFIIRIGNSEDSALTELLLIPASTDSITLNWIGITKTSYNPVSRLQKNRWMKNLATDMDTLLQKLERYYTVTDHLYLFPVRETAVVDSTLISTSVQLQHYPSTQDIYLLVEKLQAYAKKNGASQTGFPMLNITPGHDGSFLTRVALPVNKSLPGEGNIEYRWMLGGGNILVTEVKGGPHKIKMAFAELEHYLQDHHRQSPAIPFQSLVTDRRTEPDTCNWITKVYWPVM